MHEPAAAALDHLVGAVALDVGDRRAGEELPVLDLAREGGYRRPRRRVVCAECVLEPGFLAGRPRGVGRYLGAEAAGDDRAGVDPSCPTAVWATAHRNGESVKFDPAPGVLVCRIVPWVPFGLIVKAGCAASLPARKTPVAVWSVRCPAVDGNSAGEEMTPVATAGTPDAASEGSDTGHPASGEAVCVVAR